MAKKAQVWGLDVMTGFALFLVGMMIFFVYALNNSEETEEVFDLLTYDGESLADSLLSQGYPINWNPSNVQVIGITTNGKINQSKLDNLYDMTSQGNYSLTRNKFNTIYDYYIFMDDNMTANSVSIDGLGYPGVTRNNVSSKNLVKITRIVIYENKTAPLYIYIWE